MSNILRRLACALGLAAFALSAHAQDEPTEYLVDGLDNLSGVRQFSLDSETGRLLVTLQNKAMLLDTFPFRVVAEADLLFENPAENGASTTPVEGISSAMTKNGDLVVLGEDASAAGGGGVLLVYSDFSNWSDPLAAPLSIKIGTTPYSQALLSENDLLYAVNPTLFSIMQVSVGNFLAIARGEDVEEGVSISEFLKLRCGSASTISIIDMADKGSGEPMRFYFASITGVKELEIGREAVGKYAFTDSTCFKPGGVVRTKTRALAPIGRQPLLHAVIGNQWHGYDPEQPNKWVITFDPDIHTLTLFPIRIEEGKVLLRRSEGNSIDLTETFDTTGVPRGQFGLLAASDGASVVLVSHIGSNFLHRLKRVEDGLEYLGHTRFEDPIRMLHVSEDGTLAAVLTGDPRRDIPETLKLIKHPSAIKESGDIRDDWFSVLQLQNFLTDQGLTLRRDGVYGPQTQAALNTYLAGDRTSDEAAPAFPVEDHLRGMFPVENFGPMR